MEQEFSTKFATARRLLEVELDSQTQRLGMEELLVHLMSEEVRI